LVNAQGGGGGREMKEKIMTTRTIVMLKEVYETSPLLELQARRAAKKAGLQAIKSRLREKNLHSNNQGGWQLIDDTNTVVEGVDYDLTPQRVIEICVARAEAGKSPD
jgi:hypothetical protein